MIVFFAVQDAIDQLAIMATAEAATSTAILPLWFTTLFSTYGRWNHSRKDVYLLKEMEPLLGVRKS